MTLPPGVPASNAEVFARSCAVIPGGVNSSIRAFKASGWRRHVVDHAPFVTPCPWPRPEGWGALDADLQPSGKVEVEAEVIAPFVEGERQRHEARVVELLEGHGWGLTR